MLHKSLRPRPRPAGQDNTRADARAADGPHAPLSTGQAAKHATVSVPIHLDALMLLGTFGPQDAPEALIRTSRGKVRKVQPGSRLAGRRVVAIGDGQVVLQGTGGTVRLSMPGAARVTPAA